MLANTQEQAIHFHLMEHENGISSKEAIELYGITRLSAKIYDLKHKRGVNIKKHNVKGKNRYGHTTVYSMYYIPKDNG